MEQQDQTQLHSAYGVITFKKERNEEQCDSKQKDTHTHTHTHTRARARTHTNQDKKQRKCRWKNNNKKKQDGKNVLFFFATHFSLKWTPLVSQEGHHDDGTARSDEAPQWLRVDPPAVRSEEAWRWFVCLYRRHSIDPHARITDTNKLCACHLRFYSEFEIGGVFIPWTRI